MAQRREASSSDIGWALSGLPWNFHCDVIWGHTQPWGRGAERSIGLRGALGWIMALIWGLAMPPPPYVSLLLLFGFLAWGLWILFSGKQSRKQVATKTDSKVCNATLPWNSLLPVSAPEAMATPTSWAMRGTGWGKRGVEIVPMHVFSISTSHAWSCSFQFVSTNLEHLLYVVAY